MKRTLLASILLTVAEEASDATDGLLNGCWWKAAAIDEGMRLGYVLGMCDAVRAQPGSPSSGAAYGEIVLALDGFYGDPANARIPVLSALRVVDMQVRGARRAQLDEVIENARRVSAKDAIKRPSPRRSARR